MFGQGEGLASPTLSPALAVCGKARAPWAEYLCALRVCARVPVRVRVEGPRAPSPLCS